MPNVSEDTDWLIRVTSHFLKQFGQGSGGESRTSIGQPWSCVHPSILGMVTITDRPTKTERSREIDSKGSCAVGYHLSPLMMNQNVHEPLYSVVCRTNILPRVYHLVLKHECYPQISQLLLSRSGEINTNSCNFRERHLFKKHFPTLHRKTFRAER